MYNHSKSFFEAIGITEEDFDGLLFDFRHFVKYISSIPSASKRVEEAEVWVKRFTPKEVGIIILMLSEVIGQLTDIAIKKDKT